MPRGGNHCGVVSDLINAGAKLNVADKKGDTAYIFALIRGYRDIAKVLVEAGVDVNA